MFELAVQIDLYLAEPGSLCRYIFGADFTRTALRRDQHARHAEVWRAQVALAQWMAADV